MRQPKKVIVFTFIILCIASKTLGFQVTFSPRFSITEEYTDNLFLSEDDEEDEFITVVSAGFTGAITGRNTGLEISYDPAYSIYEEYSERVEKGEEAKKVMDNLGLERYCCRHSLLGNVELVDLAAEFKKF